jgi:hypothetical protein
VTGPHFFEENNHAVTVDSRHYCTLLQTLLGKEMQNMWQSVRNVWFQQDGAMANVARQSMTFLRGMFPGCLIPQCGNIP